MFDMRTVVAILILAVVAPGLVSTASAQVGPDILVKAKPKDKPKKVCKNFDAPTGSRVGATRVCRTAAEWRLAEDRAQRSMQQQEMTARAERAQQENEKNALAAKLPH